MKKYTMLDYIEAAPEVLRYNLNNYQQLIEPILTHLNNKKINRLVLIASGSSHNACYVARNFLLKCLDIEVKIITPFTFTYYENNIDDNDLILVISQSGLSTNAIEAIKKIKQLNKEAVCLTANINSDVKNYADLVLDYGAGEELVGYVTKGVTALALYLCLFAIVYSGKLEYLQELEKAVDANEELIFSSKQFIEANYQALSSMHQCYMCGAGANYGTALEGALKVGETIHIPSNCYELEEYIHGPNLQLDPSYTVFFFDGQDGASDRIYQIYQATKKVTSRTYLIAHHKYDEQTLTISKKLMPELTSLAYLPFVQILSYVISTDLKSQYQHPLLKEFKKVASAKTSSFVNYDDDE